MAKHSVLIRTLSLPSRTQFSRLPSRSVQVSGPGSSSGTVGHDAKMTRSQPPLQLGLQSKQQTRTPAHAFSRNASRWSPASTSARSRCTELTAGGLGSGAHRAGITGFRQGRAVAQGESGRKHLLPELRDRGCERPDRRCRSLPAIRAARASVGSRTTVLDRGIGT